MATLGSTATPSNNYFYQGVNTPPNLVGSPLTMPATGGYITQSAAYFRTVSGTGTCWLVIWDINGVALGYSSVSVGAGTLAAGGQQWYGPYNFSNVNGVYIAGGTTFYAGFWVPEPNGFVTSDYASGSSVWATNANTVTMGPSPASTGHNQIGAYVIYSPATARVWNGSAWTPIQPQVYASGAWQGATRCQVWNGTSWVDAT